MRGVVEGALHQRLRLTPSPSTTAFGGGPPPRIGEELGRLAGRVCACLGWSPETFWSATPAEVAGILRALAGDEAAPVGRDAVAALMEAFPDG